MSAHLFIFFSVLNCIIFPFTVFNLLVLKTPYFDNLKPFVVVSGSMEPVIPTGSLIYSVKKTQYAIGDVITFSLNNENITHRIVKTLSIGGETYFSTKGDANHSKDFDLVHQSSVYGRITTIMPLIGSVAMMYKTQMGLAVGTIVPMVFLLILVQKKSQKALVIYDQ